MVGWLFASPPVWNRVTTTYRTCPTSSSAADRRSNGLNVLLFMTMLPVRWYFSTLVTGRGYVARVLAEAVGPNGLAVGLDTAPEMIDSATRKARKLTRNR